MSSKQKEKPMKKGFQPTEVFRQKRVRILCGLIVLLMFLDWFAPRHHAHFFWDVIPGFSAVFGIIACAVLVFFSKGIGHAFLMKREDYYDD